MAIASDLQIRHFIHIHVGPGIGIPASPVLQYPALKMNKLFVSALFGLVLAVALISQTAEAKSVEGGLESLQKSLHDVKAAKAKLSDIDQKLAKTAEAFGPEGKKIYEALKSKAKAALKKGVSWLKKKFSEKVKAKRHAPWDLGAQGVSDTTEKREAPHWGINLPEMTETEKKREAPRWGLHFPEVTETEKRQSPSD